MNPIFQSLSVSVSPSSPLSNKLHFSICISQDPQGSSREEDLNDMNTQGEGHRIK